MRMYVRNIKIKKKKKITKFFEYGKSGERNS